MPLYDYFCEQCGPFRELRSISRRDEPAVCQACNTRSARTFMAPLLNLMSSSNRIAETRNEKSAHEPDVVTMIGRDGSRREGKHGEHSHAHDHHRRSRGPVSHKHAPHRPWMLGH